MSNRRKIIFINLLITLSLWVSACSTKAQPTATINPTATQVPNTATSLAPTVIATKPPAPTETLVPTSTQGLTSTLEPTVTLTSTSTTGPMTFTDGLGRQVTLSGPAQRVVSMAPSNTEILFAVGAGAQTIARDDFSDYPDSAKNLPSVGGNYSKYDLEKIVSLKPDLVLAAEINTPEQMKAIADLGVNVYLLANPTSLDQMYGNLEIVAQMTGHEAETATLVASLQARVAAVVDKVQRTADTDRPLVYYELDATDASAPFTAGGGTFVDTLIMLAGGRNLGNSLTTAWAQTSAEKIIEMNPTIILLGDAAYGTTPESVAARPGWKAIDAVKNSHIYPMDDNLVSRPGPRLVDGLEALAKIIHPELYK